MINTIFILLSFIHLSIGILFTETPIVEILNGYEFITISVQESSFCSTLSPSERIHIQYDLWIAEGRENNLEWGFEHRSNACIFTPPRYVYFLKRNTFYSIRSKFIDFVSGEESEWSNVLEVNRTFTSNFSFLNLQNLFNFVSFLFFFSIFFYIKIKLKKIEKLDLSKPIISYDNLDTSPIIIKISGYDRLGRDGFFAIDGFTI